MSRWIAAADRTIVVLGDYLAIGIDNQRSDRYFANVLGQPGLKNCQLHEVFVRCRHGGEISILSFLFNIFKEPIDMTGLMA
jgi:hypothetical protein